MGLVLFWFLATIRPSISYWQPLYVSILIHEMEIFKLSVSYSFVEIKWIFMCQGFRTNPGPWQVLNWCWLLVFLLTLSPSSTLASLCIYLIDIYRSLFLLKVMFQGNFEVIWELRTLEMKVFVGIWKCTFFRCDHVINNIVRKLES